MFNNEKTKGKVDRVNKLSHAEKKEQKKNRAKNLREKYKLSPDISEDQILAKEYAINDTVHENVKEVESEVTPVEGNIAETLITAAESGSDGDIAAALGSAKNYHQTSGKPIRQRLHTKRDAKLAALFGVSAANDSDFIKAA